MNNELSIRHQMQIARRKNSVKVKPSGKVYEGEFEIAKDEEDLVKFLIDDDNQDELITLEQKLKTKKLAAV